MEKQIMITQETTIMMTWEEVEQIILNYLDTEYNIDVFPTDRDREEEEYKVRILSGKAETPVKPVALKIFYKEKIK
jgi:hypothetical protein